MRPAGWEGGDGDSAAGASQFVNVIEQFRHDP